MGNAPWLTGKPYYCVTCGAGGPERMACEHGICQLESEEVAIARRDKDAGKYVRLDTMTARPAPSEPFNDPSAECTKDWPLGSRSIRLGSAPSEPVDLGKLAEAIADIPRVWTDPCGDDHPVTDDTHVSYIADQFENLKVGDLRQLYAALANTEAQVRELREATAAAGITQTSLIERINQKDEQLSTLQARVAELEKALEPFAKLAPAFEKYARAGRLHVHPDDAIDLCVAHLDDAAIALRAKHDQG